MKKYSFIFLFLLIVSLPNVVFGAACSAGYKDCNGECIPSDNLCLNLQYPNFGGFDLNTRQSFPEILNFFYFFIVGIAGLAAFVMLVWGGVQWLASGAIPAQASEARDKIRNAILGLLLILASFLIIQIINPELTMVGGLDLSKIDCPDTNGDGNCDDLAVHLPGPREVSFTVNGVRNVTVNADDSVQLAWSLDPKFDRCEGYSDPPGLWSLTVTGDPWFGSATVGPITTSPTFFSLDCYKAPLVTPASSVILPVTIASAGPPEPTPIVDLKVDPDQSGPQPPSDGPIFVPASPSFDVFLTSINAATCQGGPRLPEITGETSKKVEKNLPGVPPPYQYILDVTCFNNTGQSARDEVIVNVLPP